MTYKEDCGVCRHVDNCSLFIDERVTRKPKKCRNFYPKTDILADWRAFEESYKKLTVRGPRKFDRNVCEG